MAVYIANVALLLFPVTKEFWGAISPKASDLEQNLLNQI